MGNHRQSMIGESQNERHEGALHFTTRGTDSVGLFFGVPDAPCISAAPLGTAAFTVTHVVRPFAAAKGASVKLPATDCYFMMLYLDPALHADVLENGKRTTVRDYPAGSVCLVDLAGGAEIVLYSSLRALCFTLPRVLLADICARRPAASVRLKCMRGADDPVIASLADAILPLFDARPAATTLLHHLGLAICAHVLHTYDAGSHFERSLQ